MIKVIYGNGQKREYSLEVHGENFEELAKEFATKFNGTIAGAEAETTKESEDSNIKVPTEREILISKATELGLEFAKNIQTAKLAEMVAEAETPVV